jgi:nucleotide-binding universal stress UspA family protein
MYKRILAGTDLSTTAKTASDRAASLANSLGAELTLVYAGRDHGEELKQLESQYGAETVAVPGNPAEVLISEAETRSADLLVVGSVGMSGRKRFLLGNVPNKVSHHASVDTLVVKTHAPSPASGKDSYERILVGTDGSETATRAVKTTADLAGALGAELTVLCAYEPLDEREREAASMPDDPVAQWSGGRAVADIPEEFRWRITSARQADDVLDRALEHAGRYGVDARAMSIEGNAAEAIISAAADAAIDLVAVGSIGMTGAKRFALGNVPHRVSHHAPTDVLILRTG